jgi:hypothetical protein
MVELQGRVPHESISLKRKFNIIPRMAAQAQFLFAVLSLADVYQVRAICRRPRPSAQKF